MKDFDDVEVNVRENLGEGQFELAFQTGSAMTINQAIEY